MQRGVGADTSRGGDAVLGGLQRGTCRDLKRFRRDEQI